MSLVPSHEQEDILKLGLDSIRIRAGAGTGKTTTVALVIANLIAEHGLEPERILGITFTNKAAAELADRVHELAGGLIEEGRQVEVHTYHGFAAQLLAEFGPLAGIDGRIRVITPTFSRQLLTDTFDRTDYQTLDITNRKVVDQIARLGDRLGDHLLEPSAVLSGDLPDDDVWQARKEMLETLVRYEADKRRLGVVDYPDLITLSTRVLREHPHLALEVRSRYRVVVLDEYQDTNPGQRVLLSTLFSDGFPVIAVGDEDQTIYEWRGASPENFEHFPEQFPRPSGGPAHQMGLTLNRRSAGQILEVANAIRLRANPGAEALEAADESLQGEITTYWAGDALQEADWLAERFEELHEDGTPWKQMAVLFRKNKDFSIVLDAFGRHDIPVEVANVGGLLSVPEVADLRSWLTVVERPEDSAALVRILFGSRYRLGLADIAPLSRWAASRRAFDDDAEVVVPVTLLEAIEAATEVPGLRAEALATLERFFAVYREVLVETQGINLVETCRLILDRTRAWQDVESLPETKRLTARLNLHRFLDLAEDWSPLTGRQSLGAFLDYLMLMETEPAEELDSARLSGEEAVTLVTIHRAKGLEWEVVAVPAVTAQNFPSRAMQFPDPVRFADHVPVDLRIDETLDDLPEEEEERTAYLRNRHEIQEWRTAYVATTRAKRHLYVTGAYWYGLPEPTMRPKDPSPLFELVAAHPATRSAGHADLPERPALLRAASDAESPDPLFGEGWAAALRAASADPAALDGHATRLGLVDAVAEEVGRWSETLFDLDDLGVVTGFPEAERQVSVTGLVTHAQCPKRYFWSQVDPLPRRRNLAAAAGTEVHRRIELHQRGQIPFDEVGEELYDAPEEARAGAFQAFLSSRFAAKQASLVEAPFEITLGNGFQVRGRIDAVYTEGSRWEIVDFKSGRPSDDSSRIVQLQSYAIAASEADLGLPPPEAIDVTFAYLGDGLIEETQAVDEAWLQEARDEILRITSEIEAGRFEPSPGKWCGHCDFARFCGPGRDWLAQ